MISNDARRNWRNFAIATVLTIVAVALSIAFLDRPWATFAHETTRPLELLTWATRFNWILQPAMILVAAVTGIYAVGVRRINRFTALWLLTAVVYLTNRAVKDDLQWMFGRTWPEPWAGGPSHIGDGSYYFDPFNGDEAFEAFPSGTTASICAFVAVAWFWYPRGRVVYALPVLTVAAALLLANFHFLSDVIAGIYLGFSIGWIATVVWDNNLAARLDPVGVSPPPA